LNLVVGKLVGYAESNMELSRYDAAKLRFMLEIIFLNLSELILFIVIFAAIGRLTEFFVAVGALMSVRIFSGGFHFKKYRYCVILTGTILAAAILVLPDVSQMNGVLEGLIFVTILLNIVLAPVSKRNAAHSRKSNIRMKVISTLILFVYALWLLGSRDNLYVSIVAWMLFIQAVQLIIGKVLILRGDRKKRYG